MKKKIGMILILGIVCLMYINSKYGGIKVIVDVIERNDYIEVHDMYTLRWQFELMFKAFAIVTEDSCKMKDVLLKNNISYYSLVNKIISRYLKKVLNGKEYKKELKI